MSTDHTPERPVAWKIPEADRCALCKGRGFTRGYISPGKWAEYDCTRCGGDGLNEVARALLSETPHA